MKAKLKAWAEIALVLGIFALVAPNVFYGKVPELTDEVYDEVYESCAPAYDVSEEAFDLCMHQALDNFYREG